MELTAKQIYNAVDDWYKTKFKAQGCTASFISVADFNHTDIILLHDEEVADEIEKALHSRRRPVWLTLYTNDEFFGDDNDT